jgi:hypothetical protein
LWCTTLPWEAAIVLDGLIDPFEGGALDQRTGLGLMERGNQMALAPESARILHLRPVGVTPRT